MFYGVSSERGFLFGFAVNICCATQQRGLGVAGMQRTRGPVGWPRSKGRDTTEESLLGRLLRRHSEALCIVKLVKASGEGKRRRTGEMKREGGNH